MLEMANILGRMYGSNCVSFIYERDIQHENKLDCLRKPTSSKRLGKIFRIRRPSENLSRKVVKPFMKEIFSSRDFEAKLVRSK